MCDNQLILLHVDDGIRKTYKSLRRIIMNEKLKVKTLYLSKLTTLDALNYAWKMKNDFYVVAITQNRPHCFNFLFFSYFFYFFFECLFHLLTFDYAKLTIFAACFHRISPKAQMFVSCNCKSWRRSWWLLLYFSCTQILKLSLRVKAQLNIIYGEQFLSKIYIFIWMTIFVVSRKSK